MKTSDDALNLLNTIKMLQRKIDKTWEENKKLMIGPVSNDLKERNKVNEIRQELAEYKKWRDASKEMLIRELLELNK